MTSRVRHSIFAQLCSSMLILLIIVPTRVGFSQAAPAAGGGAPKAQQMLLTGKANDFDNAMSAAYSACGGGSSGEGLESLGTESDIARGAGDTTAESLKLKPGAANVNDATSVKGNGSTMHGQAGSAMTSYGSCGEKAKELDSKARAADKKVKALTPQPAAKAAACNKAKSSFAVAANDLYGSINSQSTYCSSSSAGAAGLGMSSDTMKMAGAALLGAALGAGAMALMGGGGDKDSSDAPPAAPPVVNTNTVPAVAGTCSGGMVLVSAGVCAFSSGPLNTDLGTGTTGGVTSTGGSAGTADNLGGAGRPDGTGSTTGGATGSTTGSGSTTSPTGSGGSGSTAGGGSSTGSGGTGTGGSGAGRSLASDLGYNSFGGSGGGAGEKKEGDTVASITTETYIDGVDAGGSYLYKLVNGRRIKVYVKCKNDGRCKVRNDIRRQIESDPLLQ